MNNAQIKQGIQFMTNFYEKFEFHKDLAVVSLSEYDQSLITGEKNKSPILVNILYDKLTKDRFSESVKHRIESLNFMEKAFS